MWTVPPKYPLRSLITPRTEIAAIKGLYFAVTIPKQTVLIVAPNQRQANLLFRKIKIMLNKNSHMSKDVRLPITETITRETSTVLEFNNGSSLYALPAAEDGANIRGFTANIVIIDEGGYMNDEVWKAINPMLLTTKGILMLIGSPNGVNNFFYKAFSNTVLGYKTYHFSSYNSPIADVEMLEQEKHVLSDIEFRQEYLGEFIETVGAMFPINLVESCQRDYTIPFKTEREQHFEYFLGVDPSRMGADDGVLTIIEKMFVPSLDGQVGYKIIDMVEYRNKTIPDQIRLVKELHRNWRFRKIIVDATGMGGGIFDPLQEDNLPVEDFQFTNKSKQELYFNMKRLMEGNQVIMPDHDKMKRQLIDLKMDRTNVPGQYKIFCPPKGHDDYPDSIALALWANKRKRVELIFGSASKGLFET